jgi:hypothetical protein
VSSVSSSPYVSQSVSISHHFSFLSPPLHSNLCLLTPAAAAADGDSLMMMTMTMILHRHEPLSHHPNYWLGSVSGEGDGLAAEFLGVAAKQKAKTTPEMAPPQGHVRESRVSTAVVTFLCLLWLWFEHHFFSLKHNLYL